MISHPDDTSSRSDHCVRSVAKARSGRFCHPVGVFSASPSRMAEHDSNSRPACGNIARQEIREVRNYESRNDF
jgi:hypothetical protein